jgi:hypothetical protein
MREHAGDVNAVEFQCVAGGSRSGAMIYEASSLIVDR